MGTLTSGKFQKYLKKKWSVCYSSLFLCCYWLFSLACSVLGVKNNAFNAAHVTTEYFIMFLLFHGNLCFHSLPVNTEVSASGFSVDQRQARLHRLHTQNHSLQPNSYTNTERHKWSNPSSTYDDNAHLKE